jgi:phage N-6-adenine-methyltransferase
VALEALARFEARLLEVERSVAELAALVLHRPHIPASKSTRWGTPRDLFAALDAEFGPFDLDPAADDELHVVECYFTEAMNGLLLPWFGRVFCNPPYGDEGVWVYKALLELALGHCSRVVFLVPSKTSVSWWHELVEPAKARGECEVRFLEGRLTFRGAKSCAPFASTVLVFERKA